MQTILEIYYLRIIDDRVRYQRKQANLSKKGGDPNVMIQSLILEKRDDAKGSGKIEKREFVVHSTSWRYVKPSKVVLTYVAYSDELEFEKGKFQSLPLKNLKKLTKKSQRARTRAAEEKQVVAHAMRHIAFLIKTDNQIDFKSALNPETVKIFKKLWVSLAGRVL
jgi:hypothetical protein